MGHERTATGWADADSLQNPRKKTFRRGVSGDSAMGVWGAVVYGGGSGFPSALCPWERLWTFAASGVRARLRSAHAVMHSTLIMY